MRSTPLSDHQANAGDALDRLFMNCSELESLVASILQAVDKLNPDVASGRLTAEHAMNLAYRIEAAERGLLSVTRQINDKASACARRRQPAASSEGAPSVRKAAA